jgi:hypothetical protein
MWVLVVAVYFPVQSQPQDNTLDASDYDALHIRRIRFVQQALFEHGTLPAWYPRELMGTPFWSNVQNFPFIPTRLVLLWMDPLNLMAAGVMIAALLAATFTFFWARTVGVGRVGAAAAGWTFACAGFFASRVMAGHLPLLEAYPALPLLLWRVEKCVGEGQVATGTRAALRLGVLALCTCCVMLAGHPQLPVYAVGAAGLYVVYRGWRRRAQSLRAVAAMALGGGCAAFALWPMAMLVARSTRVLPLDPAANDYAMPYARLLTFLIPKRQDSSDYLFWDTVCYIGWVPVLAAVFLLVRQVVKRRRPTAGPLLFVACIGIVALLAALPAAQQVNRLLPGTFLRSPARLLYLTSFALAIAAGVAIDLLSRRWTSVLHESPRRPGRLAALTAALVVVLAAHVVDLTVHDRTFVRTMVLPTFRDAQLESAVRGYVGDGRVGIDYTLALPLTREIDDVGFFESIMLAKPYAALADLAGVPPTTNVQHADGSELARRALVATGTRLVLTTKRIRPDLKLMSGASAVHVYAIPDALPRAAFYPSASVSLLDVDEIHRRLRAPSYDVGSGVMLDRNTTNATVAAGASSQPTTAPTSTPTAAAATYQRPSSDEIVLRAQAAVPGVLRVLESWDPGWRVTVDGVPADVLCADDVYLAVALPAGTHEVIFRYVTPGAATGIAISIASLCLLSTLVAVSAREKRLHVGIDKHPG